MGTFNDGDSGSSIRTKINTAIQKTEGSSAISTIDVDGGAIDGVTLGTNSAVTEAQIDNININGNAVTSTNTNGNIALTPNGTGEVDISKVDIDSGAIDGVTLGTNSAVTEAQVDNININGNAITSTDSNGNIALTPNGTGEVDISKVDIDSGAIDGVTIGTNTAVTDLRVDNLKVDGNAITSTDTNGNIDLTPNGNGEVNISKVDIDSGAIDGVTIGTNSAVTDLRVDNLKADGNTISTTDTNGNLEFDPNGSGKAVFKGNSTKGAGQFVLNCEQNSHGITVKGPPHSAAASYTLTLPNTDGSANEVLKTDGSGNLDWVAQSGGGGADLYAANEDSPSAQPSATGANAIAIGDSAVSSGNSKSTAVGANAKSVGNQSVALGNAYASGTMSFATAINSNLDSYGAKSSNAVAMSYLALASASYSIAIGYTAVAAGVKGVSLGNSYSSGTDSLAAAIANNTSSYGAQGANSIAMGSQAKVTNQYGIAIGYQTQTTGGGGGVAIGRGAKASNNSISIGENGWGGGTNYAQGQASIAIGQNNAAEKTASVVIGINGKANVVGKYVYSNGYLGGQGNAQTGTFVLISDTTSATAEALTTNNSTASTDNQIVLENNTAMAFHGTIVARQQAADGTACAAWKVEGLIRREGSAGTTVLVNSATTVLDNTPNWGMALSADTTNGCLKIQVNGAASTDIRWNASISTSEVTYA